MDRNNNGNEPLIKSYSISQMYSLYCSNKLIVNRRYQRKLCWTIEEKRNFIDTIMNNLRSLSSQARGDVSKDMLMLNEMSNISLSNHKCCS